MSTFSEAELLVCPAASVARVAPPSRVYRPSCAGVPDPHSSRSKLPEVQWSQSELYP